MPISDIKRPGVHILEIPSFPPSVVQVATAIPAFIGYTEKHVMGALDLELKPTKIASMLEYEKFFGKAPETNEFIFEDINGTLVASLESDKAPINIMNYAVQAYFANGGGPCYIVSVGKYGAIDVEKFKAGLEALASEDEPTLIVFPESQKLAATAHKTLLELALQQCETLKDRFLIADLFNTGEAITSSAELDSAAAEFRMIQGNEGSKYGAAYFPNVKTVLRYVYDEAKVDVAGTKLSALKESNNGQYNQAKQAISNVPLVLPPSSLIAGVYAQVDRTRGVWKAPANIGLGSVSGVTFKVTDKLQDDLNVHDSGKSINAIREFANQGIIVWGARTLDGNSNEWRYVPVRRFFNMVEESVKKACNRFVFEPNDANTWVKVRAMIENFLMLQWRDGALQGSKPEQAFFVRVGLGITMDAQDILEGRMIVEIGMAAVRPAEFIILKFSHKMPEA